MTFAGTILLVDDDANMRKSMREILRPLRVGKILEATNGVEALSLYHDFRPDLVLLDLSMPDMDGLETLNRLREMDPISVVVICSSHPASEYMEEVLALGAANYICKARPPKEIGAALRQTIRACFGKAHGPATGSGSRPPGGTIFPFRAVSNL